MDVPVIAVIVFCGTVESEIAGTLRICEARGSALRSLLRAMWMAGSVFRILVCPSGGRRFHGVQVYSGCGTLWVGWQWLEGPGTLATFSHSKPIQILIEIEGFVENESGKWPIPVCPG